MRITINLANGDTIALKARGSDKIDAIKTRIGEIKGIPVSDQQLFYAGKPLSDERTLSDYKIGDEATIFYVAPTQLETEGLDRDKEATDDIERTREAIEVEIQHLRQQAKLGSFDSDIDIVDPELYYRHLKILAESVIQQSELLRCLGIYDLRDQETWDVNSLPRGTFKEVPDSMRADLRYMHMRLPPGQFQSIEFTLSSLWKTFLVVNRVLIGCRMLRDAGFCRDSFNMLLKHRAFDLAEIVKISIVDVYNIHEKLWRCLSCLYNERNLDADETRALLWSQVYKPCEALLIQLNWPADLIRLPMLSKDFALSATRMTAVLLDLALVSYTGSHGCRFDTEYLSRDAKSFRVDSTIDSLGFQCSLRRLTCLKGFLNDREVWVFKFITQDQPTEESNEQALGILTKMDDFADIWGPVYAIPGPEGTEKVRQYNVSKGIICKAGSNDRGPRNAIRCHWYNKSSWLRRFALRYLPPSEDSCLSPDDLLLIGDPEELMVEKENCRYTLDAYEEDFGLQFNELGTRDSAWRWENGGISMGVGEIVGVTVSGTRKWIPETTLKETILNKWLNNPESRNPHVLNQYLGVEVSHCSGNARRIPIRTLLTLSPMVHTLERQFPNWREKPWGAAFWSAVSGNGDDAIESVWARFEEDRPQMGRLVAFALDLLGPTGLGNSRFNVAFLHKGQEASIDLNIKTNTWAELLKDTPLMASFSLVTDCCLLCNAPDDSSTTCSESSGSNRARTTLQCRISVETDDWHAVKLRSVDNCLRRHETGSLSLVLRIEKDWSSSRISRIFARNAIAEGIEVRNPASGWGKRTAAYIQASDVSYGGMAVARTKAAEIHQLAKAGLDESTELSRSEGAPVFSAPDKLYRAFASLPLIDEARGPEGHVNVGSTSSTGSLAHKERSSNGIAPHPNTKASESTSSRLQSSPKAPDCDAGEDQEAKQPKERKIKFEFDPTAMGALVINQEGTQDVVPRVKGFRERMKSLFGKSKRTKDT